MLSHRKFWSALSVVLAGVLLLSACAPAATPTPQVIVQTQVVQQTAIVKETQVVNQTQVVVQTQQVIVTATPPPFQPKGTLNIGLTSDIGAIEVPYAPERQASNASWSMYDSLIYLTADGQLQPALADSWDVSADGTTYTFHLRKDVTFHNGEPFNADAVVFSYNTYSQKEVTYANTWLIASKVEKVDDYTVKVSSDKPNALLLKAIAKNWSMIPPKYWAQVGKQGFAQHPVGTGPFVFKEWVKGDHLTVTANPNYWRAGYPLLAQVVFKIMPEAATRVAAIKAGEIDLAPRLTSDDAQTLLGEAGIQVIKHQTDRAYYVAFNNLTSGKGQPTEKPEVRIAMNLAVNRPAIVKAIFSGYASLANGFTSAVDLGYDKVDPFPYDPDKAKQMLKDAGFPNGFSMGMTCPDGAYPHINEVCQAVASDLKKVGINVDLKIMEANSMWDLESKQQLPPLFIDSWSVTYGEAYERLQGSLGKGQTYAAWYDPQIDQAIQNLATNVDQDKRAAAYADLSKYMRDNPPFVYLYFPQAFEAISTRVIGYKPRPAEDYYLWDVGVSDGK